MKSMVALLMLWGTAACTDEVLVDMEKPGIENNSPEAGRITSLKNILPDAKPGYQGVDSRANNSWVANDELLLKIQIKDGAAEKYTAWMTLLFDGTNWKIKSTTIGEGDAAVTSYAYYAQQTEATNVSDYNTLPLVTPITGIILNDDNANFKAIIPEEISTPNVQVELIYAPDLEWKDETSTAEEGEDDAATTTSIALQKKSNTLTETPEYWTVQSKVESNTVKYEWTTTLARICVNTGAKGDVVTLNSNNFTPHGGYEQADKSYTAITAGTNGIAYFYGTLAETTSDFNISLTQVMISSSAASATNVFIPTTLFEASTLNKVKLEAKTSYLLDGTDARTQALNDSEGAVVNGNTYNVSGVNGLLQWLKAVETDKTLNLTLKQNIVLPQYVLDNTNNSYTDTKITYDVPVKFTNRQGVDNSDPDKSNWGTQVLEGILDNANNPVATSNWNALLKHVDNTSEQNFITKSYIKEYTGTINGNNHTITGLRLASTTDYTGFVSILGKGGKIENLHFVNAIVTSTNDVTGIIAGVNKGGTISHCSVSNSVVYGAGSVGAIVGKNCAYATSDSDVTFGTVEECTNNNTIVKGNAGYAGGIVGECTGTENYTADNSLVKINTNISEASKNYRFDEVGHYKGSIIKHCTNNGGQVIGNSPSGGHTGGIIGMNAPAGYVIACVNNSTVSNIGQDNNSNVGGIAGCNAGNVVACGNIGNLSSGKNLGGIIGYIYNNGKAYGCWTKDTNELPLFTDTAKDGFGVIADNSIIINNCELFSNSDVVDVTGLNTAINRYNNETGNAFCSWNWTTTPGPWPTLKSGTTSTNP